MATYLSHPVRRILDEPRAGETISLVVELGSADSETLRATVAELSGSVERELQFDSLLIELPQSAVAELCAFDGLARIETANTLSMIDVQDEEVQKNTREETSQ